MAEPNYADNLALRIATLTVCSTPSKTIVITQELVNLERIAKLPLDLKQMSDTSVLMNWGGPKKPWNLFIKNCVSLYVSSSVTFKVLSIWCRTPIKTFFWTVFDKLKAVFELVNFDAFSVFCCFLFHLFHISKTFPFEDYFHPGNKQTKSLRVRSGE